MGISLNDREELIRILMMLVIVKILDSSFTVVSVTVKPVTRGHLIKCPYMTGVPSSQVHFNVKVHFASRWQGRAALRLSLLWFSWTFSVNGRQMLPTESPLNFLSLQPVKRALISCPAF